MRLLAMRTARFTGRLSCPPPAHCKQNDRCANITIPVLHLPAQINKGQDICYSSSLHTTQLDPFQKQNTRMRLRAMRTAHFTGRLSCPPWLTVNRMTDVQTLPPLYFVCRHKKIMVKIYVTHPLYTQPS